MVLFGSFLLSILLNLAKVAPMINLIKAIIASILVVAVICVSSILLGILGMEMKDKTLAPLLIPASYALLAIPFSFNKLRYFLVNISFPFLFAQLALMITLIYFKAGQDNMTYYQGMTLHLIPVGGYLLYVWLLPKLARKVMRKEARPFR